MPDEKAKPRHGCLFYGAVIALILLFVLLTSLFIGYRLVKKTVAVYTDTKPVQLPVVQLPASDLQQLETRVDTFREAVRAGQATAPLVLTATELNALINASPDLGWLRGKFYLIIEDNKLKGKLALPLDQAGFSMLKGRYLNGTATFRVALDDGTLTVTPQSFVTTKGKPLPSRLMERLRSQNLARKANLDPKMSVALDRLEKIQISDGKLILVPRANE